jgi:AcrR family transcriptional regulator
MKDQILEAAVQLLGQHGLRKLTGPQVAKKAKVRQSHVTYYFPHRSDLVGAVARRYIESVAEEAMRLAQQGRSTDALITAVLGDRRRVRTLISLLVASEEDTALRTQLIESVMGTRALIASMLELPPGDKTPVMLQALLWGLGLQHFLLEGKTSESELSELVALAHRQVGLPAQKGRKRRSAA